MDNCSPSTPTPEKTPLVKFWRQCPEAAAGLTDLIPLALPKGQHLGCIMCDAPAYYCCKKCDNAYYCTKEHMEVDFRLIHSNICDLLKHIKGPIPFSSYASKRAIYKAQRWSHNKAIMDISYERARRSLRGGLPRDAIRQGSYAIRFAKLLFKQDDVQLILLYLIFAEAYAAINRLQTALEFMAKSEYIMSQNKECPSAIKADFYKTRGVVNIYANKLNEAISSFSNEIIFATDAYHTDHKRTGEGYFNLGTVFLHLDQPLTAISLFVHAVDIMSATLLEEFEYLIEVDAQDILGFSDQESKKGKLGELETNEMQRQLYFILEQVTEVHYETVRADEEIKILFALSLLRYVMEEYREGLEFINRASQVARSSRFLPVLPEVPIVDTKMSLTVPSSHSSTMAPGGVLDSLKFMKKHLQRQLSKKVRRLSDNVK